MTSSRFRLPFRSAALLSVALLLDRSSFAQAPYDFKKSYDGLHEYYSGSSFSYAPLGANWYYAWGWTLLGYIRMYEATGDKAYLNKFVLHSYNLQMIRTTTASGPLLWEGINEESRMHYSSELSRPMAEFVYLIRSSTPLGALPFLPDLIPSTIEGQTVTTYGAFATWLENRVYLTLNYLTDSYWINDSYGAAREIVSSCERDCFDNECDPFAPECWPLLCADGCVHPAHLNMQADLAVACYFLSSSGGSGLSFLKNKADHIAEYFKSNVSTYPGNQSKTWFDAPDDPDPVTAAYRDDVAHGASNIQMPLASYLLDPGGAFSETDMQQFASTFSNNIWDVDDQVFHNSVFGTDDEIEASTDCNNVQNCFAQGEILSWMPLADFDQNAPPNDIYTLLTVQGAKLLSDDPTAFLPSGFTGTTHNLSGTQSYYGLSEVVKAQWSRECADLVLGNRLLPYDQDFAAKHVLRVDAGAATGASFADPVITEPIFTVEADVQADFRAGAAVVFDPGFVAEYGSEVVASIDPLGCDMEVRSMTTAGTLQANREGVQQRPAAQAHQGARALAMSRIAPLRVLPNPNTGHFIVEFGTPLIADSYYSVYDAMGRLLYQRPLPMGATAEVLDLSHYGSGTYAIKLTDKHGVRFERVVLE